MTTYENYYFKIKVDFPSIWRVRCGSNTPVRPESQIQYQLEDNDLPMENDDFRTLLFASCDADEGSGIIGAGFSIVIHRHLDGFDLFSEMKKKGDLLECEFELSKILNREAKVIKTVENAGSYNLITKVIAWEEIPEIWVSIYIRGNSLQNFRIAEEILNSVARI